MVYRGSWLVLRAIFVTSCLSWPTFALATNHLIQIDEISAGCGGDRTRQFVEIRVSDPSQHAWTDVAELAFFDASGHQVGEFPFRGDPEMTENRSVLIATAAFAAMPGAPVPDFVMPAHIAAPSGQVCFRSEHGPFPVNVCLAYGQFTGNIPPASGPPAPALPVDGSASLQRVLGIDSNFGEPGLNGDFALAVPAPTSTTGSGTLVCSSCGNGVLDAGEDCDDGNAVDGDCCSPSCTFAPRGESCADDGEACTVDVCDGAGGCSHAPDPCQRVDSALGCVAAVSTACAAALPQKSTLSLTGKPDPTKRKLTWKWTGGPGSPVTFGNPLTDTDYVLCVYENGPVPELVLRAAAPAGGTCHGKPCWAATSTGFKFTNRDGAGAGVTGIVLKTGSTTKLTLKGKGELLDMPELPLATPVRVQLKRGDGGACWEANYSNALKATPEIFKAKSN